jgi:hypothetical protein
MRLKQSIPGRPGLENELTFERHTSSSTRGNYGAFTSRIRTEQRRHLANAKIRLHVSYQNEKGDEKLLERRIELGTLAEQRRRAEVPSLIAGRAQPQSGRRPGHRRTRARQGRACACNFGALRHTSSSGFISIAQTRLPTTTRTVVNIALTTNTINWRLSKILRTHLDR